MSDPVSVTRSGKSAFEIAFAKAAAEYELPETEDAELVVEDASGFFFTEAWFAAMAAAKGGAEARVEAATEEMLDAIDRHLDAEVSQRYKDQPLAQDWARVAKVCEEAGEALDDFILYTEQNPRKVQRGDVATLDDVLGELADTAITAMLGMTHFTKDARRTRFIVQQKLIATYQRIAAFEEARNGR